ncbi:NF038122 family metalloprotease [uncultured Bradyrhizobium sp.]|jgi:hypothetical protein|uniref:NF038122 family metalloprotease n=1 Tax=uncultured Bradyrhizobium sp. TaxID=199684 RepID=UPI00263A140E|nr:NF038122 family metalloprotease [uncultured Bradyrhizobium sp.]
MIINLIYDSSANNAPSAFVSAMNYVVNLLESTFTDAVTINIDVGWGEVGGQALGGALGASIRNAAPAYTYAQIRSALVADATSAADSTAVASLGSSDPTSGGNFDIGTADAKALGLVAANGVGIDGWVGFTNVSGIFTFDPNNRAVAGEYDFIGVALHEITEVMGRVAWLGNTIDYPHAYSVMDLFRYASPGVRQLVGGQAAYFSVDGGHISLNSFNTNAGGDYGDWDSSAGSDSFLAFSASGVANLLTSSDIALMDAIGWNTGSSSPSVAQVSSVTTSGPGITNGNGDLGAGAVVTLSVIMSQPVTVSGGTPTLLLNDGGVATYTGGSGTTTLTFSYTVAVGQNTGDLQVTSIVLNGATIKDLSAATADMSGAVTNPVGTLQIDTTPPQVSFVSTSGAGISNGNGDLGAGSVVSIAVHFIEAVKVTGGTPTLVLNDGGVASYASGSGTSVLTFTYTVASGQNTGDLQVLRASANGSSISDGAGNAADLTNAASNPSGSLQIDTMSPLVQKITMAPSSGSLVPGNHVSITVLFSEAVTVTGAPTLSLNDGASATYQAGSGTTTLTFDYAVSAHDSNAASLSVDALNVSTGHVTDGAGNSAILSLASLSQVGPQVHTTEPVVTHLSTVLASGDTSPGSLVKIVVAVSEPVSVTGAPTLLLNDGGVASYDPGASTLTSQVFDYVVGANDQTTNLAIVSASLAASTIKDAIGDDLSFAAATTGTGTGLAIGHIANGAVMAAWNSVLYALGTNLAFQGNGHDSLVLSGTSAQYTLTSGSDSSVNVSDLVSNRDFGHVLTGIEALHFTDKVMFVENQDNANIARLYSAALGRAPDQGGLFAWEDLYASGITQTAKSAGIYVALAQTSVGGLSIAGGFTHSAEFQDRYGSLDDSGFVGQLYQNVLNRSPSGAEVGAWLNLMHGGESREMVLVGFAESVENIAKTAADWLVQV